MKITSVTRGVPAPPPWEKFVTIAFDEAPTDEAVAALRECVARSERYEWLLPLVCGSDTPLANTRTALMALGLMRGLDGDALVKWAMEQPQ